MAKNQIEQQNALHSFQNHWQNMQIPIFTIFIVFVILIVILIQIEINIFNTKFL